MTVDARTLALAAAILCSLQSLGMLALWLLNRRIYGIGAWTVSNVANAICLSLMILQGVVDDKFWTYVVPNFLNMAATAAFYVGSCHFTRRPVSWRAIVTLMMVGFPIFLYFLYIRENQVARMYVMGLLNGALSLFSAGALLAESRAGLRFSTRFTGTLFVFGGVMSLYRMAEIWSGPKPHGNFDNSFIQVLTFLLAVGVAYLWTFGTFLMVNQHQTMELAERHEAQRRIEGQLMQARQEAEEQRAARQRQLLARDLHDGLGGITANLALLATLGREEETEAAREELLRHIEHMAIEGNREIRTIMNTLESGIMRWPDWLGQLRQHAAKTTSGVGIQLVWDVHGEVPERPMPDTAAAFSLLRALKEAVSNLVRHSGATRARVRVDFRPRHLRVRIWDNGRGLSPEIKPGRGLGNMARRAQELGGALSVRRKEGTGLHFVLPLPLEFPESKGAPHVDYVSISRDPDPDGRG